MVDEKEQNEKIRRVQNILFLVIMTREAGNLHYNIFSGRGFKILPFDFVPLAFDFLLPMLIHMKLIS